MSAHEPIFWGTVGVLVTLAAVGAWSAWKRARSAKTQKELERRFPNEG